MAGGHLGPADGVGPPMQQILRCVQVPGDDVAALGHAGEHELSQLVEVGHWRLLPAHLSHDIPELIERETPPPGSLSHPLQVLGTVALGVEQSGVHEPARGVEH